ncbi:hypothetical protein [Calidithermus roseus]|uniref:Uncharacterized protein n=1 Tax=Calidithermus roseus TaxID=1644118 RepID=A0A399ETQ8_9DEIN|nr:hypothetical protein [Calidithermus roseus]RIH87994.1 hypothetical protein Mrose_01061 [Calidithermus roseus]
MKWGIGVAITLVGVLLGLAQAGGSRLLGLPMLGELNSVYQGTPVMTVVPYENSYLVFTCTELENLTWVGQQEYATLIEQAFVGEVEDEGWSYTMLQKEPRGFFFSLERNGRERVLGWWSFLGEGTALTLCRDDID